MKPSTHVALLATLICASACAQDVNVTSTTMAQMWKQDTPGFDKATYLPTTEYLGIDATGLGCEALALHLYGWGTQDLQDQSMVGGKNAGNLTYGYLQYSFNQANANIKAGRFTVNQGVGNEQVDGVSARTDLRYGFSVSAFAGLPVIYKNLSNNPQNDISFQRNLIFGSRVAWQIPRMGELGVSYLQDGTSAAKDLPIPEPVDNTRKQVGTDVHLDPCSFIDITGRTVFDIAKHPDALPGTEPSSIAEHNYVATFKLAEQLRVSGTYIERNFYAYYAGSTLPSLFNMNEKGMFTSTGGSVTWGARPNLQVVADLRRTDRETYGNTTRIGADVRYSWAEKHILAGAGYHKINAFDVTSVDPAFQSYSLSHSELRAWVMAEKGALSASLDGIRLHYADAGINPNLNTKSNEFEVVGSVGYQVSTGLKVSGDLSLEDSPLYDKQVMALLRVEYRFGFTAKGGK